VGLNPLECWPLTHPLTLQPGPIGLKCGDAGSPMMDPIGSDTMSRILRPNSSLQNRLVRWGVPPLYKLFLRILSIWCGTKSHRVLAANNFITLVVYWLQIGFAGNLKSRHDLRHCGTILLAGSKDPWDGKSWHDLGNRDTIRLLPHQVSLERD